MIRVSLKWKVFLYLVVFCAFLLGLLWLFQIVFLDDFYRSIKVTEVKTTAKYISTHIDNTDLTNILNSIVTHSEMYIEILCEDGTVFFSSDPNSTAIEPAYKRSFFENLIAREGEFFEYLSSDELYAAKIIPRGLPPENQMEDRSDVKRRDRFVPPMHSIMYASSIQNKTGELFWVLINTLISPVSATVTTLRYQLSVITTVMILLAVLLAFLIARHVSKPIEDINRSAKVLAEGIYDVHFDGRGFLEIGELSDTLNTAAAELNKVETLRRELLANISHDLRTPLSLIYGYAEMMHDFPDEVSGEHTQTIMDETKRLTSLVNDVLDISKLEAGIERALCVPYNLTARIRATVDRLRKLLAKDGYTLIYTAERDVQVCADEIKITQVCYNLLINAVNYTGSDKTIRLTQTVCNDIVRIAVSDSGNGVADSDLPYIWDRYYKVDKQHKRPVTGSGLGLSIVKKVILLHGGSYGVDTSYGRGSTFWFELGIYAGG